MHIHRKVWFNFFSQNYALFELQKFYQNDRYNLKQFVSATLKQLNKISWNYVVMMDIPCRCTCTYPHEILIQFFFLRVTPFLNLYIEIWPKWQILPKQFVSTTSLKQLNRIWWNYIVIMDIPCRCAYPQEILIQFFFLSYALFELRNLAKMKVTTGFLSNCNH